MKKDTKIFKDNLKNGQKVVNLHNVLTQFKIIFVKLPDHDKVIIPNIL